MEIHFFTFRECMMGLFHNRSWIYIKLTDVLPAIGHWLVTRSINYWNVFRTIDPQKIFFYGLCQNIVRTYIPLCQQRNRQFVRFTSIFKGCQLAPTGMSTHPGCANSPRVIPIFFNYDETLISRFLQFGVICSHDWVFIVHNTCYIILRWNVASVEAT